MYIAWLLFLYGNEGLEVECAGSGVARRGVWQVKIQFFDPTEIGIKARAGSDSVAEMLPYQISIKILINRHLSLHGVSSMA